MKKIGLYGGTFDPIHLAHLIHAQFFVEFNSLDTCYFIPASVSPFKQNRETLLTTEQRLDCLELAIQGNKHFAIELFELNSGGVSYSVDTVGYFKDKFPHSEIYFLIGMDQAKSFKKWKDWELILKMANVCVLDRHNKNHSKTTDIPFIYLDNPIIELSSSNIRARLKLGLPITYLVPETVEKYLINLMKQTN